MKLTIKTHNALISKDVDCTFTIDYCKHENDYVAHEYAMDRIFSAGRYESIEEAFSGIVKRIEDRGLIIA